MAACLNKQQCSPFQIVRSAELSAITLIKHLFTKVFRFISHVLDNTHISASQSELVTVLAGMLTWLRVNHKLEGNQVMLQSLTKAFKQNLLSSFL